MSKFTHRTCRHCLGAGCIHCNGRGQVRQRLWTERDIRATALRVAIFGERKQREEVAVK